MYIYTNITGEVTLYTLIKFRPCDKAEIRIQPWQKYNNSFDKTLMKNKFSKHSKTIV